MVITRLKSPNRLRPGPREKLGNLAFGLRARHWLVWTPGVLEPREVLSLSRFCRSKGWSRYALYKGSYKGYHARKL